MRHAVNPNDLEQCCDKLVCSANPDRCAGLMDSGGEHQQQIGTCEIDAAHAGKIYTQWSLGRLPGVGGGPLPDCRHQRVAGTDQITREPQRGVIHF